MRWREPIEWVVLIAATAAFIHFGGAAEPLTKQRLIIGVAVWAALKTAYYFGENLKHLQDATATDLAYHKFLLLLAYNMAQITISFALDFYCLVRIDRGSLNGIDADLFGGELLFECFYFSVLNF